MCDGVVFSQYSRIICFANDLSIFWAFFLSLYSLVAERQACKWNVAGSIPTSVTNSILVYNHLYCFKATIGLIFHDLWRSQISRALIPINCFVLEGSLYNSACIVNNRVVKQLNADYCLSPTIS